ncbi:MAG: hypothetical protein WDO73_13405 [Ignavibacteriota bacterium]
MTDEAIDNLEADLLTDLYNPHAPGFFSAYLHGRKHPDLRFLVRPRGAFPGMSGTPEEVAVINLDPASQPGGYLVLIASGKGARSPHSEFRREQSHRAGRSL